MAEEPENDDKWLYGDNVDSAAVETPTSAPEKETNGEEVAEPKETAEDTQEEEEKEASEAPQEDAPPENDKEDADDSEKQNGKSSDKEDYDEDSDDDVNVVIRDIKTSTPYPALNIKRGGLLTSTAKGDKSVPGAQGGKFSVEEFEQAGSINGVPVTDFNLDILEDKPWRKPGADITDYFNYGFNEDTWKGYCERQKRMRVSESGTGLLPLNSIGMPRGPIPIMNDNSKYSGNYSGVRKAGPPPGRRMTGSIDVIGGVPTRIGTPVGKMEPPKENVIQVMTADRREYSRKPGFPDMSMPPPTNNFEEFQPEYGFNPEPEPFYGGYEPTQDSQWSAEPVPVWQPQEIRSLTPAATIPPPVMMSVPPPAPIQPPPVPIPSPSPIKEEPVPAKPKERERESKKESEKPRDRERERSHRRERSRSRSRRHKSRSRSPGHRSHRKKKSRRHEESE